MPVEDTAVVTKSQIWNTLKFFDYFNFQNCKIWLETTIDGVTYAAEMAEAATPVEITGSDKELTYDVSPIDVSTCFEIDENAGTPTYSLEDVSGDTAGTGRLRGAELTVTKIGVFRVKLTTAAQGTYATGEKTITLTITGKQMTDDMVTVDSGPYIYTGSAVTPAVTVTDGSKTLVSGTDYTVSYENNTDAGTATVTVTGMGNYIGAIINTFEIILTDEDKVAAAKKVVEETLEDYTATNSTTKEEIQEEIDKALANAGISDVTVTVGDIIKTEATSSVEGSVSGSVSITKGSASDSVPIIKTIPGATDTPGTPTATPGATDTPDTSEPTPGTTDTPVTPTATPGTTGTPDQTKPDATPGTESEEQTVSKEIVEKNELSLNAQLKISQTGKKINTSWGKVAGADGYDVYVQYCGKKFTKKSITAIKSGMVTSVTITKVNGKPLNLKKNYKIYILAYKLVDGKKVTLSKTIIAHIVGRKNTKYTNVKVVKVKKKSYSLKKASCII